MLSQTPKYEIDAKKKTNSSADFSDSDKNEKLLILKSESLAHKVIK